MLLVLLSVSVLLLLQKNGLAGTSQWPELVMVDTISESNWTNVEVPKLSLPRVHRGGLLHRKVWIIPFDEMWHLGLSKRSAEETCAGSYGPIESHVTSGASVASAASEIAARVKRNRRVAPLMPLGRPFLLQEGHDREVIHTFALLVQGTFLERSHTWFPRVLKPVQFIREAGTTANISSTVELQAASKRFCTPKRALWMTRAVAYAMRRFKLKGIVPKSDPMNDAKHNEAICCREEVASTEDLEQCALQCDGTGLYNILPEVSPKTTRLSRSV